MMNEGIYLSISKHTKVDPVRTGQPKETGPSLICIVVRMEIDAYLPEDGHKLKYEQSLLNTGYLNCWQGAQDARNIRVWKDL